MNLNRRRFIKLGLGATGAALTTAFPFRHLQVAHAFGEHPQEKPPFRVMRRIPQVCARACETDCAYYVMVGQDPATGLEKAVTLEGRPEDPVSRGKYCIKGLGFVDSLYNPDRLMVTLKRTNPKRGIDEDPGWVVMKTSDAVEEFISRFKQYKPQEIVMCSPGDPYTNRLCQSIGCTRSDQRTECFGTHYYINCLTVTNPPNPVYSSTYTPSHHIAGFDFSHSRYEIWFGFDSFSKAGKAGILNHMAEGKHKGTRRIMFNPLRTTVADAFADEYYTILPGTDLAVALAMIRIILNEKLYQAPFLKNYSDAPALIDQETGLHLTGPEGKWVVWSPSKSGPADIGECLDPSLDGGPFQFVFEGRTITAKPVLQILRESVADYTPGWAEKISRVRAGVIERITREFMAAAPEAFIPALKRDAAGPNYANSWKLRHCINMINFLSGAMDHNGGILLLHGVKIPWLDDVAPIHKPYPPQPDHPVDGRHHFPVTWDIYKNKDFSAPGHYGTLGHGLFNSDQTKVVFFRNPHRGLFAMIQPQMLEAALEKMELVADWNLYLDDIGYWCDYVFAAGHQFEGGKLDLRLYYPKYPCLVGGAPVQKPPGDQIGWGTLARQIGLAVAPEYWTTDGSRDPDKAIVDTCADQAVRSVEAAGSYKEFIEKGAFWIDKRPYENYRQIRELAFGAPEGRVRFYIDELVQAGYDGVPGWSPQWHASEAPYQFALLITRAPWLMHADPNFINNPALRSLTEQNFMDCIWMNPEDARELGVEEGEMIRLENNPRFMTRLPRPVIGKAHISERVMSRCILTFHGMGHRAKNLTHAADFSYRDGDLIPQKDPELVKKHDATGMGWVEDVYVKITRAS
jgi:anaerobic selenocysteine-containing dehydrogenase